MIRAHRGRQLSFLATTLVSNCLQHEKPTYDQNGRMEVSDQNGCKVFLLGLFFALYFSYNMMYDREEKPRAYTFTDSRDF